MRGAAGVTGPAGSQGLKGETGPAGPRGLQGIQGIQGLKGDTGATGPQGLQGLKGDTGATGPQGLQGIQGLKGETGPAGPRGLQGIQGLKGETGATGTAASIKSVAIQTSGTAKHAYCYNEGSETAAELVFVIPPGEIGPRGATGATGPQGATGAAGQPGLPGRDAQGVYGGLYNLEEGEFEVQPDEIVAMTFSGFLPASGMWYDDHHSVVVNDAGTYEIAYALRAKSLKSGQIQIAVTNDGVVIPCSQIVRDLAADEQADLSGTALVQTKAGAHLHFIVFAKEHAKIVLRPGVNLSMHVKKAGV
jgi:hypothetical protein